MAIYTQYQGCDKRSIFKRSLNSEISFTKTDCHAKVKEPRISYYIPIDGRSIVRFPRVLALLKMQTDLTKIRIRVTVPISYDAKHNTTSASLFLYIVRVTDKQTENDKQIENQTDIFFFRLSSFWAWRDTFFLLSSLPFLPKLQLSKYENNKLDINNITINIKPIIITDIITPPPITKATSGA